MYKTPPFCTMLNDLFLLALFYCFVCVRACMRACMHACVCVSGNMCEFTHQYCSVTQWTERQL